MRTLFDEMCKDPEKLRLYCEEALIFDAAEEVAKAMEDQGVSRAELARRLGKTRGYITQFFKGGGNVRLRTLARILFALGLRATIVTVDAKE